ncbi:hypothetical protein [Halopiger djelfimassiliensis]|uniref:hypothetical protein n=1 Tax=Halopiger djelfimassiliensis TaxID=1293047 RepID=UPI0009DC325C|nr:hypothetical protein [Halopiger djelfimassiliensis]
MSSTDTQRRDDLLIAVALTEFSVQYEAANPELAERAWQLAADRLLEHDVEPNFPIVVFATLDAHRVARFDRAVNDTDSLATADRQRIGVSDEATVGSLENPPQFVGVFELKMCALCAVVVLLVAVETVVAFICSGLDLFAWSGNEFVRDHALLACSKRP